MKLARSALAVATGAITILVFSATSAFAQSRILPTVTPVRTDGGWIYWLGWLSMGLAALVFLLLVALYMRRAPRFAKDEDGARVVRADRVIPGREPPRRLVDVTQAVPVVAQPPTVLAAAPAAAPAAATATVTAPAPVAAAAPASAPAQPAAPAEAAQAEEAPAEAAPAAEAAPPPAAPAAQAAPAPPAERVEVTMDQAVYEKTLEELLAGGADRRIAEGKAKRAGMIAARKAAEG